MNKKLQTSKVWKKQQQQTNRQTEKKPKLSKTRWQQKTTIDLCNRSIGLHEFLEDRHEGKVSMSMKAIQTLGTSKHKRLFKGYLGLNN